MAPNASTTAQCTGVLDEHDAETIDGGLVKSVTTVSRHERRHFKLVWRNIIAFTYVHIAALYGGWLMLTAAKFYTVLFGKFVITFKNDNQFVGGDCVTDTIGITLAMRTTPTAALAAMLHMEPLHIDTERQARSVLPKLIQSDSLKVNAKMPCMK